MEDPETSTPSGHETELCKEDEVIEYDWKQYKEGKGNEFAQDLRNMIQEHFPEATKGKSAKWAATKANL